jgi:hypothetical protein
VEAQASYAKLSSTPKYNGLDAEQSRRADQAARNIQIINQSLGNINLARQRYMTQNSQNMEDFILYKRAQAGGISYTWKRIRQDNPDIQIFYSGAKGIADIIGETLP